MSIRLLNWVLRDRLTQGSDRCVLIALANNSNDRGECFPSLQTIADTANIDRRQAIRIIKKLEEMGVIKIVRRRKGAMNQSNIYQIIEPEEGFDTFPPKIRQPKPSKKKAPGSDVQTTTQKIGSDIQTTKGGDAQTTTPSDIQTTRVVVGMSPEPLINHQLEPSLKPREGENKFSPPPPSPAGEIDLSTFAQPALPGTAESAESILEDLRRSKQERAAKRALQVSGSANDNESAGLIKNPGAYAALERAQAAQRDGGADLADYPEDVRQVIALFCKLSGIHAPARIGRKGGEYALWIEQARELKQAAGEFGGEALTAVFEDLSRQKDPFSVFRPGSVSRAVRAKAGELRLKKQHDVDISAGVTMTDEQIEQRMAETRAKTRAYLDSLGSKKRESLPA